MTSINRALEQQLARLRQLLLQLDNSAYCYASPFLSGSSIGQHTRHIIELVQCLHAGYEAGVVNYDKRKRDKQIETNKQHAIAAITTLTSYLDKPDKTMLAEGNFDSPGAGIFKVTTTFERELIYNIEHAIHHMALIKVALNELKLPVDADFGVAYATVEYRKLCAQ